MLTTFLISSLAFAQSPEEKPSDPIHSLPENPTYAKETIVDMTGAEVTANGVGPSISFVQEWKPHHEGSLIRLRTSFVIEMNQSVSDVK